MLAAGTGVFGREHLDRIQRELRLLPGVTALIYDQHCAADLRRKRKRGLAPERAMRVIINERVCEGCGDCGVKSNCLSVLPVDTEFGRKTRIHQSSCNTDYSCLDGDCPAFATAVPVKADKADKAVGTVAPPIRRSADPPIPSALPEPTRLNSVSANLYFMGIGGTGVVTVNQVLGTAAMMDGYSVRCLDQTGLSQKGGAVVSHLKITSAPAEASNKVGMGEADGYIGFDLLTAADARHLMRTRPDRSVAIVSSSRIPTGLMVRNAAVPFPESDLLHRRIDASTRADRNVYLDAETLANSRFGSHMAANFIVVGAAYQAGLMPMKAETIEQAITLNGASTTMNIQAFRLGRQLVLDPDGATVRPDGGTGQPAEAASSRPELERLLSIRVPDLVAYQDARYAESYRAFVERVAARERELGLGSALAEAVARYLYKLMAYKDEYEVARLYLEPAFRDSVRDAVGDRARISYRLHPPALRAMGLKQKLALGAWFRPVFHLLRGARKLRGTALDPFGRDAIRKLERELIVEYRAMIERELGTLSRETHGRAVALAKLPDMVRGYEDVKRKNVERYRLAIGATLTEAPTSDRVAMPV
jgi:indolepyruvate ferredoxin oxidoreductase